jgi:hypothetical protein
MKIFEYNSASVRKKYFKLVENSVKIQKGITSLLSSSFIPAHFYLYFFDTFISIPPFSVSCLSSAYVLNIHVELLSVYVKTLQYENIITPTCSQIIRT